MAVYSHSRLSTFENCPRQFEYRYVQKIPVEREGIEAFVGKRVHEILERLYHHVRRHSRPPSLRQVLERFQKDWAHHWHDEVQIVRVENDVEHYQGHGRRCLENYYRSEYPFDRDETIALEHKFSADLDPGGRYKMRGVIDRLVRREPGAYEVHDYKTGAYLPPKKRFETDRQLAFYRIGIEQSLPDVESVGLVWHYLNFNKTVRSQRSAEQIAALREETIERIDQIERATTYRATPSALCRWCDFREICPDAKIDAPRPDEEIPFSDAPPPVWLQGPSGEAPAESPPPAAPEPERPMVQLELL